MYKNMTLKNLMISFIRSIELSNRMLKKHMGRTAVISYLIGLEMALDHQMMKNLVVAAALHDIGLLDVKDKKKFLEFDTRHPADHAKMGHVLINPFESFAHVGEIIKHHHVHWNEMQEQDVPMESYIVAVAEQIEILLEEGDALWQKEFITQQISYRNETEFAPFVVETFMNASDSPIFWYNIDRMSVEDVLDEVMENAVITQEELDGFAMMYARIMDYVTPDFAIHALSVGAIAFEISKYYGLSLEESHLIKAAGIMHEIGHQLLPVDLIHQPVKTAKDTIHPHQYLREAIGTKQLNDWLDRHEMVYDWAYPIKMTDQHYELDTEIIAFAELFTLIKETTKNLSKNTVINIMREACPNLLSAEIESIIEHHYEELDHVFINAQKEILEDYPFIHM